MDKQQAAIERIERTVERALALAEAPPAPPRLGAAMHYAVLPRGSWVRPRLCLSVALACGDDRPEASAAAGAAIEFLHCASLIHDDLPCFDNADMRRGKPSVHRAFGEPIAVLAGDALIVLAFETVAREAVTAPDRMASLITVLGRSVGMPAGIAAGQAWESEPTVALSDYQRAKTGALFIAATEAGAAAAGQDPKGWTALGEYLGEAYQVADDIRDVTANPAEIGKPTGRDAALGRPSAVAQLGLEGALDRLNHLVSGAVASVPDCPGREALRALALAEARRLLPQELRASLMEAA